MSNTDHHLRIIQQGFQETGRLLNRRQYNLSMVKARQTLEFMVRFMGDRACIVDSDLMDTINQLYEGNWITKSSQDHYHKIRIIGNRAIHDGDRSQEGAERAFQLLSQEMHAFSQVYIHGKPRQSSSKRGVSGARRTVRRRKRRPTTAYYMVKFLIPLIFVLVLISIIWAFSRKHAKGPKLPETTPQVTVAHSLPLETFPPSTPVQAQTAAPEPEPETVTYVTTKNLNVRPQPSTEGTPLTTLKAGTEVEVIREEGEEWLVILYNDQEAYVSSSFLKKK